ncbi:hypothetical protein EI94DRAFT_911492 [Lactarius quietus]|nr:hypothetical protein EI94DRAFT_911492 [Lactarius quietus]
MLSLTHIAAFFLSRVRTTKSGHEVPLIDVSQMAPRFRPNYTFAQVISDYLVSKKQLEPISISHGTSPLSSSYGWNGQTLELVLIATVQIAASALMESMCLCNYILLEAFVSFEEAWWLTSATDDEAPWIFCFTQMLGLFT